MLIPPIETYHIRSYTARSIVHRANSSHKYCISRFTANRLDYRKRWDHRKWEIDEIARQCALLHYCSIKTDPSEAQLSSQFKYLQFEILFAPDLLSFVQLISKLQLLISHYIIIRHYITNITDDITELLLKLIEIKYTIVKFEVNFLNKNLSWKFIIFKSSLKYLLYNLKQIHLWINHRIYKFNWLIQSFTNYSTVLF